MSQILQVLKYPLDFSFSDNVTLFLDSNARIRTEILLVGRNDDQTVTLPNGLGLVLNGPATLAANQTLSLVYDGTNYVETARSN